MYGHGVVVKKKTANHRREERVEAAVPVIVGRARGLTHDISASGMFLETDAAYKVGSAVEVELDLVMPWGKTVVRCTGTVVRSVRRDNRIGMAVVFNDLPTEAKLKPKSAAVRHRRAAAAKK